MAACFVCWTQFKPYSGEKIINFAIVGFFFLGGTHHHGSKLPTNSIAQHLRLVQADSGFGFVFGRMRQGYYSGEFPSSALFNLNPLCLIFRSDLALRCISHFNNSSR